MASKKKSEKIESKRAPAATASEEIKRDKSFVAFQNALRTYRMDDLESEKNLFFLHATVAEKAALYARCIVETMFAPNTILLPPNMVSYGNNRLATKDGREFEMEKIDVRFNKGSWYVYSVGYQYSKKQEQFIPSRVSSDILTEALTMDNAILLMPLMTWKECKALVQRLLGQEVEETAVVREEAQID